MIENNDYSVEEWVEYINNHIDMFDIFEYEPDRYKLYRIDITPKYCGHFSGRGEDVDKEVAYSEAIKHLADVLYEHMMTPERLIERCNGYIE